MYTKCRRRKNPISRFVVSLFILGSVSGFVPFVRFQSLRRRRLPRISTSLGDSSEDSQSLGAEKLNVTGLKLSLLRQESSSSRSFSSFISKEQLDDMKQSIDIVTLVESYGLREFRRTGKNSASCICPFHDDRNPSLKIDGTRGIFKCFACGKGGDAFSFVRQYSKLRGEAVSFYQAMKLVNDQFPSRGILCNMMELAYPWSSRAQKDTDVKRKRVIQANVAAALFYENCLVSVEAGPARAQLQSRGLVPQTVKAFRIGFAPDAYFLPHKDRKKPWGEGSLVNHLKDMGFTAAEIVESGLAVKTKKANITDDLVMDYSTLIDRFRSRIVIPIFDSTGKEIIGFGGRFLESQNMRDASRNTAKYLNSPETVAFQKKKLLFGQHMAKRAVRFWEMKDGLRAVVIVEGYIDVISLWQAGIRESVSCMGTSLTAEQLTAAARIAGTTNGRIILCFDNDSAGINALERLCSGSMLRSVLEQYPVELRIASLPDGVKDPDEYIAKNKNTPNVEERFREEVLENSTEWTEWYIGYILSGYSRSARRGMIGSFGDIFDRLASFLGAITNPGERTKRACALAEDLTFIIALENNVTQVSKATRIQIESDLVERASNLANINAAIAGRIATTTPDATKRMAATLSIVRGEGISGPDAEKAFASKVLEKRNRVSRREEIPATHHFSRPPVDSYSRGRVRKLKPLEKKKYPSLTPHFSGFDFLCEHDAIWLGLINNKRTRNYDWPIPKNLTNELSRVDGTRAAVYFNSNEYHGNRFLSQEAVSVGYKAGKISRDPTIFQKGVGSLLEVNEEIVSGLAEDACLRTLLLFPSARKSLNCTIEVSKFSTLGFDVEWSTEVKSWLFSRLVSNDCDISMYGQGNLSAIRTLLSESSNAYPGAFGIKAPSFETDLKKQNCFVEINKKVFNSSFMDPIRNLGAHDSFDEREAVKAWSVECPDNDTYRKINGIESDFAAQGESSIAAGSDNNLYSAHHLGSLDYLFAEETNELLPPFSCKHSEALEETAQLSVQESYTTLLWLCGTKRLSRLRKQLEKLVSLLSKYDNGVQRAGSFLLEEMLEENKPLAGLGSIIFEQNSTCKELEMYFTNLMMDFRDELELAKSIISANRRVSRRLMDHASYRNSAEVVKKGSNYENLNERLQFHMTKLAAWTVPEDLAFGNVEDDYEYEELIKTARNDWGELFDDDKIWSPKYISEFKPKSDKSDSRHLVSESSDDDEESMDDFMERIGVDWGWLEGVDRSLSSQKQEPYVFKGDDWGDELGLSFDE